MARKPSKPGDSAGNGGAKPRSPRASKAGAKPNATGESGGAAGSGAGAMGSARPAKAAPKVPASRARSAGFLHGTSAVSPLAQIERLRVFRPGLRGADSIASEVERFARELAKHEHAAGGLARSWATLAPQAIQQVTRVDRLHGGVLTVIASDASAKYDAEMWLAEGGLAALRGVAARTLRRVKVTIG